MVHACYLDNMMDIHNYNDKQVSSSETGSWLIITGDISSSDLLVECSQRLRFWL